MTQPCTSSHCGVPPSCGQRAERVVELLRLGGRLGHQRPQQVLLVGEVQVEGAVRGLGDLDDVVDPGGVVAPLVEGDHGRVEQLAHGAPALAAQDALAGRRADGVAVGERRAIRAGRPPEPTADFGVTDPALAPGRRLRWLRWSRADALVADAGSRRTLGDPMPGEW